MTTKTWTITLSYPHAKPWDSRTPEEQTTIIHEYRVEKIGDSVAYAPGEKLSKKPVSDLCENDNWRVTIVPVRG